MSDLKCPMCHCYTCICQAAMDAALQRVADAKARSFPPEQRLHQIHGDTREKLRPKTSAERKAEPVHSGVLMYFPDALAAVSRLSLAGNRKHNPGEPLHWARGKSMDQMDALTRHTLTRSEVDPETGELEAVAMVWRGLAELQLLEEKRLVAAGVKPYSGIVS